MSVPTDPEQFFTRYVPERFAGVASQFAGRSSAGSLLFRVVGAGEWRFRLDAGTLRVEPGPGVDSIAQVSVSREDFEPLIVKSAARLDEGAGALDQLVAFRALGLDAERAAMIKSLAGNVCIAIVDGGVVSRIVLTPGAAAPNLEKPECEISIELADFLALQQGVQNPIELLMNNKIRITGNAQLALALSGLFA